MFDTDHLIKLADAYKAACNLQDDTTVSYRVFGDSKKLGDMRRGADITTRRFNAAVEWFGKNWPEDSPRPAGLLTPDKDAAA